MAEHGALRVPSGAGGVGQVAALERFTLALVDNVWTVRIIIGDSLNW